MQVNGFVKDQKVQHQRQRVFTMKTIIEKCSFCSLDYFPQFSRRSPLIGSFLALAFPRRSIDFPSAFFHLPKLFLHSASLLAFEFYVDFFTAVFLKDPSRMQGKLQAAASVRCVNSGNLFSNSITRSLHAEIRIIPSTRK